MPGGGDGGGGDGGGDGGMGGEGGGGEGGGSGGGDGGGGYGGGDGGGGETLHEAHSGWRVPISCSASTSSHPRCTIKYMMCSSHV